jgi:hypothetical protein
MSPLVPRSPAMNPVVAKMPVPTMFEITSAVALKNPSCRRSPGSRAIWVLLTIPKPQGILDRTLFSGLRCLPVDSIVPHKSSAPSVIENTEPSVPRHSA